MHRAYPPLRLAAFAAVFMLAGCAGTRPVPYTQLSSAEQLRANQGDESDRVPYQYSAGTDWRQYSSVVMDRVEIYAGEDNQFEDVSNQDRQALAQYMQQRFGQSLAGRFALVREPVRNTLRVRVTLTGAKLTTRVVSTVLRFDLAGGPYNAVQAARDKEGALTGSVSYAVEIFDATSNRLLYAYVSKQFPNAWNLGATLGKLDASKVGIDKGADDLVARLK